MIKQCKNFLHNMKYLFNNRIAEDFWNNIEYEKTAIRYGNLLKPNTHQSAALNILNPLESLNLIIKQPKSFYRFGDGEIEIMTGGNAGTQPFHPGLAEGLYKALTDTNIDAYIGIGYDYFNFNIWDGNEFQNKFYLLNASKYRNFYIENCNSEYQYIDTGFTQRYFALSDNDRSSWFDSLKKIFQNKRIVLFMGMQSFKNLSYYVYEEAADVAIEYCPSRDAYSGIDEILDRARRYPRETIICLAIGAASKVIAYILTKEGYITYDLGHMLKDYDSYKKQIAVNRENAELFYEQDYKLS